MKTMQGIALVTGLFCLAAFFYPSNYYYNTGYDLATGEMLKEKRERTPRGKLLEQERVDGYRRLYKLYQLYSPEPCPVFICGTEYRYSPLDIQTMNRGWEFWGWNINFLFRETCDCWNEAAPEMIFFRLLEECDPPQQDARKIFEETLRLRRANTDPELIKAYLQKQYDAFQTGE